MISFSLILVSTSVLYTTLCIGIDNVYSNPLMEERQ